MLIPIGEKVLILRSQQNALKIVEGFSVALLADEIDSILVSPWFLERRLRQQDLAYIKRLGENKTARRCSLLEFMQANVSVLREIKSYAAWVMPFSITRCFTSCQRQKQITAVYVFWWIVIITIRCNIPRTGECHFVMHTPLFRCFPFEK